VQIRERQWFRGARDLYHFLTETVKQLLVLFEYLTVSLDINNKISNKKIISNDESF